MEGEMDGGEAEDGEEKRNKERYRSLLTTHSHITQRQMCVCNSFLVRSRMPSVLFPSLCSM